MFLKIVNVLAQIFGPALILVGIAAWFTQRTAHTIPSAAATPVIGGVVISGIAVLAALEEKKQASAIALGLACVVGIGFAAWTYFA